MELPAAFLAQMQELLGEEYTEYMDSFQEKRIYGLRLNRMKVTQDEFSVINPYETEQIPWIDNGYFYQGDVKPGKHPYYFAGMYYLQEPSAMTPANRLPIEPGDKVLDICAAPGGKSTELAAKLNGTGLLVSNDISNSRAKALLKNLELFGTTNAIIMSESPHKMVGQFGEYFDKILIDAPCSGEGMFRKEPAVIKSWVQNGTEFYEKLQREIVTYALQMLKPGGMLLYSTCTFNPGEDEGTVMYMRSICPQLQILPVEGYEGFCSGRPDAVEGGDEELRKCVRIFPHKMQGEGHFLALLQKGTGEDADSPLLQKDSGIGTENLGMYTEKKRSGKQQTIIAKSSKPSKEVAAMEDLHRFLQDVKMDIDLSKVTLRGENVLYLPCDVPDLKGLRILRSGLLLGDYRKGRFEPSQALAMALRAEEYAHCVQLPVSDERVIRYLKGETIEVEDLTDKSLKGWQLVCVDKYPLGWAKGNGTSLKNKYLAGWRWQ